MPLTLRDKVFADDEPVVVSICCITYNHGRFITECIEGFLDQECDFRVEIIIHDDASTDGTAQIVKEYADRHPTIIRAILQDSNQYSKAVNPYYAYVFPAARGKYIAICDGDDYWSDPAKLARQANVLDENPEVVITYGPVKAWTASGETNSYRGGAKRDLSSQELKDPRPINTLTACFRNIFQGSDPPMFLRNSPIGDLTVWGILGYHGTGRYLADMPPANYRIHDGGILSMVTRNKQLMMTALAQLNMAAYHSEKNDLEATKRSLWRLMDFINKTEFVELIDIDPNRISLISVLRLWNKHRKRRRRTKKA